MKTITQVTLLVTGEGYDNTELIWKLYKGSMHQLLLEINKKYGYELDEEDEDLSTDDLIKHIEENNGDGCTLIQVTRIDSKDKIEQIIGQ